MRRWTSESRPITYLDDLSKGPFSNDLLDLVSVSYVVVEHFDVTAILIIIACDREEAVTQWREGRR